MARRAKRTPAFKAKIKRHRLRRLAEAKVHLQWLIEKLGGACAQCGEMEPTLLSVDHVDGITWKRSALRYDARVKKYWDEYRAGVRLRALCHPCNGRFGQALFQGRFS